MKLYSYNRRKIYFTCIAIVMTAVFLMGRLAYLMVAKADYYNRAATGLHERERSIKAPRGRIYDRNGNILADNKAVCSVSVIHSQIEDEEAVIQVLNEYLDKGEAEIRKKVTKVSSRELIATNVAKETGDQIRELNVAGIKVDEDYKRYYPYGSLASKVLGFTGADNQGIVGLEVWYNEILAGEDGSIHTVTDAKGIELPNVKETRVSPVPGDDLVLSLDLTIQKYATQAALSVMEEKQAKRVAMIIMNPQNGEIYAMVDVPEYDLNQPFQLNTDLAGYESMTDGEKMDALNNMWRNFTVSDTYEPGSTFKIVTATAALEAGTVSLSDTFYCPGYKIVEDRRIRCHKTTGHGSEDFRHALMNSCNPAFMTIGERTGATNLYQTYQKLGLFQKTGIDLPGEANSIMHKLSDIGPVELATMSFGQSFQISPIQFVTAAATVINGGNKITPHIGMKVVDAESQVMTELQYPVTQGAVGSETSATMRDLLESVVAEGGGSKAQIEGYRIGGKTATSEKYPRGTGKYISSFLGFAPANDPQVMAFVMIDEPTGVYYGGTIAAPVIQEVFSNILPYLGIPKEE
ncbi:peptidoglycan glycosyltransferase [Coprococcus eutactus]|jgi:stage V sporulation protein D (sporulation-specific penicillin-binding protein)|uniref:peptidoglycan D,D-transpeptidase FtsI family protein n=1 Tax=Clostridia TaxID=186801 RepID=UPI000E4E4672|nr:MULTISPECIES: penicillin-binding transpeptidase domain-containing protein [Clostridia]RHV82157.1 peptidoglycan glycosyltransferase [Clostridium sp. OF10-22XD]MCB5503144.1 peptidoglycan glycosyltransferase [Coprococcus eutactus]NSC94971.1 peptidoglycan glycosyltransferase [Coprococcus eutactus]NSD34043.1 peptidoglycan glycosyltransferase [Coprococcus eutactus]RGG37234.1 peptidoglycan glycosyltransferase [Clostridium sp. AF23-6LB]